MKRLLALSSLTLALACASTSPEGVVAQRDTAGNIHADARAPEAPLGRFDEKVGTLEARASLRLQDRLARCGKRQDCRAEAIARYQREVARL